ISVPANASLEQIRDSINNQLSSKGISASIISDSSGARLMLSSELTGAGNDIYVTGTGGVAEPTVDPTLAQEDAAAGWLIHVADAQFGTDGLNLTSKDNTVNVVQGLSLKQLEKGTSALPVPDNTEGVVGSLEAFVMAHNTLL